jgi:hypothetical protein
MAKFLSVDNERVVNLWNPIRGVSKVKCQGAYQMPSLLRFSGCHEYFDAAHYTNKYILNALGANFCEQKECEQKECVLAAIIRTIDS